MSPNQTIAALGLLWLAAVLVTGVDAGTAVGFSALWTWVGGVLLLRRWQVRRVVHAIRRLTHDERAAVMASLGSDPVRVYLESELREHGHPETEGPVERFYVSPVDQREVGNLAYVLLATAIVGAVTPLARDVSSIGRIALWGASGAACVASVWCLFRARWYRRFYEVSAFGIRSMADGAPLRTLRWVDGVWIVDRPRLNRLQFLSADRSTSITIPYRVVGFNRLLAVLIRHLSPRDGNESGRTAG